MVEINLLYIRPLTIQRRTRTGRVWRQGHGLKTVSVLSLSHTPFNCLSCPCLVFCPKVRDADLIISDPKSLELTRELPDLGPGALSKIWTMGLVHFPSHLHNSSHALTIHHPDPICPLPPGPISLALDNRPNRVLPCPNPRPRQTPSSPVAFRPGSTSVDPRGSQPPSSMSTPATIS